MNKICMVLIIVGLIILIVVLYCMAINKPHVVEQYAKSKSGFADITESYTYPIVMPDVLTRKECSDIIHYSHSRLVDSLTVGGNQKKVRNSKQCWVPRRGKLAKPLIDKISAMYNIPVENAEDLQVVRYLPDQYYNEHHDACCDDNVKCTSFNKRGGHRILTVLIYLSGDFGEGETYFKNLDWKVKPDVGSAIVFRPLSNDTRRCHPLALHAGLPVKWGQKWVANLWFREGKFE